MRGNITSLVLNPADLICTHKDVKLAFVISKFRKCQLSLLYWRAFGNAAVIRRVEIFYLTWQKKLDYKGRMGNYLGIFWMLLQTLQENSDLHIISKSKFHIYSQGSKTQWKLLLRGFLYFFHVVPFSFIGCVLCFLLGIFIQLFFFFLCLLGE